MKRKQNFFARTRLTTLVVLFILLLSACTSLAPRNKTPLTEDKYAEAIESIKKGVRREMKKNHIVGMSIAIVDGQNIVWSEGFGYASKTQKTPATADTIYRVGSISKLFTATAIMQLAEQGKMDIDKPLRTYLPDFNMKTRFPDSPPITVRSVLTHHAGLPRDRIKEWHTQTSTQARIACHDLAAAVSSDYVWFPPNFVMSYSNLGFSLLGEAVARASGENYDTFIASNIFIPLHMYHSSVFYKPELEPFYSKGYFGRREVKNADIHIRDIGAGALLSSANDLAQFVKMILADGRSSEGAVLRPGTLNEMITPQNLKIIHDGKSIIGLAYMLDGLKGLDHVRHVFHGGWLPPFTGILIVAPEQKLGVVILCNTNNYFPPAFAAKTLSVMIGAKTNLHKPERPKIKPEVVPMPKEKQDSYRGLFGLHKLIWGASLLDVRSSDKSLTVKTEDRTLYLIPTGGMNYYLKVNFLGIIPVSLKDFTVTLDFINDDMSVVQFMGKPIGIIERIGNTPVPEIWKKRVGKYELTNSDPNPAQEVVAMELLLDKRGLLLMKWGKKAKIPLKPLSEDAAVMYGMGDTIYTVLRKGEEHIMISGFDYCRKK